jgi:hypothetical protein
LVQVQHVSAMIESAPAIDAPLHATAHFLWMLARHFERQESSHLNLLWPQAGRVHAVNKTARNHQRCG